MYLVVGLSATVSVVLSAFFLFPFHLNQFKQIQSVPSGLQICSMGAFLGHCCTLLDLSSSVRFLPIVQSSLRRL